MPPTADLLSAEQQALVSEFHRFLLQNHDIDCRVVSEPDVADINRPTVNRFSELSSGLRSTTGCGLLLVIVPGERRVRLEVSQALGPVYTDAFGRGTSRTNRPRRIRHFAGRQAVDPALGCDGAYEIRTRNPERSLTGTVDPI